MTEEIIGMRQDLHMVDMELKKKGNKSKESIEGQDIEQSLLPVGKQRNRNIYILEVL